MKIKFRESSKEKIQLFIRVFSFFILFQTIFGILTFPLLIFYGPFENVKRSFVASAMTTYTHQYLATFFLSDKAIERIMSGNVIDTAMLDNEKIGIPTKVDFNPKNFNDNIEVYNIDGGNFEGKLLVIHDPTRIVTGYSSNIPLTGETTSSIAKRNKSVAAINAGGFVDKNWAGTGGAPLGFVIHNGKIVHNEIGDLNKKQDTVAFNKQGALIVGRHSVKQLMDIGVQEGVTFGPPLIINGQPTIKRGDGGWGIAPRSAIAQRKDGSVLLLAIDGRSISSFGATLKDVQDIFLQHGAVTAANLDGGSSTSLFYNGKIINKPSDALGERSVPTVFMVSSASNYSLHNNK